MSKIDPKKAMSSCVYKESLIRHGLWLGIMHKCKPRDVNATVDDILDWTPEMVFYLKRLVTSIFRLSFLSISFSL